MKLETDRQTEMHFCDATHAGKFSIVFWPKMRVFSLFFQSYSVFRFAADFPPILYLMCISSSPLAF